MNDKIEHSGVEIGSGTYVDNGVDNSVSVEVVLNYVINNILFPVSEIGYVQTDVDKLDVYKKPTKRKRSFTNSRD